MPGMAINIFPSRKPRSGGSGFLRAIFMIKVYPYHAPEGKLREFRLLSLTANSIPAARPQA
jgi:hypothetical protein